jgi:hypothetical protein
MRRRNRSRLTCAPPRGRGRSARRAITVAVATILLATLSACGPPSYRFYASDTNELVLKMPRSWNQVRAGVPVGSDGRPAAKGNWVGLYDAAPRPSAEHVQSGHATSPVAVVASFAVSKDVGSGLTDDALRDQLFPVTASARALAPMSGFTATGFELLSDQTVQTRTARGIHEVFIYDHGQGPEVYDQIAVTDSRKTRVHVLLVHCTRSCYDSNRSAITETVRSFTVKIN